MANYVSGTSSGILDKNNSKKNNKKKRIQPTAKPASPSTAGLGLLGKDPSEVAPSPLRTAAQEQGPLGMQMRPPEDALANIALQRRTAQQNITPGGGNAGALEEAERLSKFQKKRTKRTSPSPLAPA